MRYTWMVSFVLFLTASSLWAQGDRIIGQWKTIDDETNKAKSVVEIYKQGGKYYGKIVDLFRAPGEEQNPVCDECDSDDPRYNKPVRGMVIITGLEWDPEEDEWDSGEILDPANGEVYDLKVWLSDEGNLRVRGYLYFFYRTQTWYPYD